MINLADFTHIILAIVLGAARMTGFMSMLSPMSTSMIPGTARRVAILSFTIIFAPVVYRQLPADTSGFALCAIGLKEVLIGVLIGFFANVPFFLSECIGSIIDNQRGSTMSEVYSPLSGTQVSTTGILFTQITTVLFFVSGMFLISLAAVYKSYQIWPLLSPMLKFHPNAPLEILGMGDSLLENTLILSAPILIVMFLATVGLGLVNRTAPQLNVFFLSMPIKSALGIFMLIIYLHYLLDLMVYDSDVPILGPVRNILGAP